MQDLAQPGIEPQRLWVRLPGWPFDQGNGAAIDAHGLLIGRKAVGRFGGLLVIVNRLCKITR